MNKRTAIIDLDSVMFSIGNPNKVVDTYGAPIKKDGKFVYEEKTNEQLVDSAEFIMNTILRNCKCDNYIAFIKGKDTVKNKRLIDPNYKADRSKESPKWWDFTKGYLIENWKANEVHDIEVDDAVNISRLLIPNSFMVCIDSDLLGLEGTHYKWRDKSDLSGTWITTSKEQAKYKFWSDMITGTHNNTKGIPGKGEKFVEKLLANTISIGDFNVPVTYVQNYYQIVMEAYVNHFGEDLGIEEFYKNYKMIKILEKYEGFQLPGLTEFKKGKTKEISEEKGIFD